MDTIAIAALCGAFVGAGIAVVVMQSYRDEAVMDANDEAYENGWSHGYEVGINQPKQSRPRAKKKVVS